MTRKQKPLNWKEEMAIMQPFSIIAVRKDGKGNITHFKLDNAQEIDYQHALNMCKAGALKDVQLVKNKNGREVLRSEPDKYPQNNLDNLPGF